MRWIILSLFLCGFTPLFVTHDSFDKVDKEFNQIEETLQDEQFNLMRSTPNLSDLKDRQIVIVSSNGWSTVMWRDNQEIYALRGSCVTVRR